MVMLNAMISFDASELSTWADKPDARHRLPQLLQQLILATASPERIRFPSGSSVDLQGWDGVLEVETKNAWVPAGSSRWELSVQKDPQKKADEDYEKRTDDPLGVDPSEAAFVFVTPRRWPGKTKWMTARQHEASWRTVLALDADDLVAWLDAAPSVAIQFAAPIRGYRPDGVVSLHDWWTNWASVTAPALSPELVIAGRGEQMEALANWAAGPPQSFYVQAGTRDEATAFLAACALVTDGGWGTEALARAVVVRSQDSWQSLQHNPGPLVLIRHFEGEVAPQLAVGSGHHVLTPLGPNRLPQGNGCRLPPLGRDEAHDALKVMGLPDQEARSLMRATSRKLGVMRRRLSADPGGDLPAWASPSPSRVLVTLSLVGQWDQSFDGSPPPSLPGEESVATDDASAIGDRQIIEQITGRSYAEVEETVTSLALMPDAPIMRVGEKWRLTSHEEAWDLLAPRLTTSDIQRFETAATELLLARSPEFDMPPGDRYAAPVYGRTLRHSETLRRGVMRSLALMGARGQRATSANSIASVVSLIVSKVLSAGSDWRLWATLDRDLPTLAEAAPEQFLDAVEDALGLAPTPFGDLFAQHDGTLFTDTPHAGVLWALERLAWAEEHFSRVALILARLTALVPDTTSNHPRESLQGLFERGLRFTEATDAHRLEVLQTLLERQPAVTWDLLIAVVQWHRRAIILREPPAWRPWGHDSSPQVTNAEHQVFLKHLHDLLLEHVGADAQRWADVVNAFTGIQRDVQGELITRMSQNADALRQHPKAAVLWHELRTLLSQHRTHHDAAWAMDEGELTTLEAVYRSLTPADPITAVAWLFADWPPLPDVPPAAADPRDYHFREKRIADARRDAVRHVFEAAGAAGVDALCEAAGHPYFVGVAVADGLDLQDALAFAIQHAAALSDAMRQFTRGVFEQIVVNFGWLVLDSVLNEVRTLNGSDELVAAIYRAAPIDSRVWHDMDGEPDAVQAAYWTSINVFRLSIRDTAEADDVALRLLAARRSWEIAWLAPNTRLSSKVIIQVLAQLPADIPPQAFTGGHGYYVAKWLTALDQDETIDDEIIAGLEFPFIDALVHDRPELTLHRVVLATPSFFADLVSWCFKRSDGQSDEPIDEQIRQTRARNSFRILEDLKGVPGLRPDGTVDGAVLSQWVTEARRLCRERGRESIGDSRIGAVLAAAPAGPDGIWPCEPVRDILEDVASRSMERGFITGKQNLRGATMRDVFEGGTQERNVADGYRRDAARIVSRWPSTARILRELASRYKRDGQDVDDHAQWRDLSE